MKRPIVLEWLTICAVGLFVAICALFAACFHPSWPTGPLTIVQDRWKDHDVYLQVGSGSAGLFSEIDFDSQGPYVVVPRNVGAPKLVENHQFDLPGLDFQYCTFESGPPVWSVVFSLAYPAALSLLAAVLLVRRLRRVRRRSPLENGAPPMSEGASVLTSAQRKFLLRSAP